MDRVTQLQDALEQLFLIMRNSLLYLTEKTPLNQVSSKVPLWKSRKDKADPPETFIENQKELVRDLMEKAKRIEVLIDSLPPPDLSEDQNERLLKLDTDMRAANEEYRQALERAKSLHKEVSETLRFLLLSGQNGAS
ncbi:hypothetical protein FRC04_001532 [Tulasnella sp. 424]|nr:hypothetical protein FRC04_001532 [Tulasnella sp. 424]KAG8969078.1 hypothetical protein FRC05_001231 [Tulasnella sp. 425]